MLLLNSLSKSHVVGSQILVVCVKFLFWSCISVVNFGDNKEHITTRDKTARYSSFLISIYINIYILHPHSFRICDSVIYILNWFQYHIIWLVLFSLIFGLGWGWWRGMNIWFEGLVTLHHSWPMITVWRWLLIMLSVFNLTQQ